MRSVKMLQIDPKSNIAGLNRSVHFIIDDALEGTFEFDTSNPTSVKALWVQLAVFFSLDVPNSGAAGSLCDQFALAAVPRAKETMLDYELRAHFGKFQTSITREEIIAADAYAIADAMMVRRSKGNK